MCWTMRSIKPHRRLRLPRLHSFCKRVNAPGNRKRKRKRGNFYLQFYELKMHSYRVKFVMDNAKMHVYKS